MRRIQIMAGPLTVAVGLFFQFDFNRDPMAIAIGPLAIMWTPLLQDWGVEVW